MTFILLRSTFVDKRNHIRGGTVGGDQVKGRNRKSPTADHSSAGQPPLTNSPPEIRTFSDGSWIEGLYALEPAPGTGLRKLNLALPSLKFSGGRAD